MFLYVCSIWNHSLPTIWQMSLNFRTYKYVRSVFPEIDNEPVDCLKRK